MPDTIAAVPIPNEPVSVADAPKALAKFLAWVEDFFDFVAKASPYQRQLYYLFEWDLIKFLPSALTEAREHRLFTTARSRVLNMGPEAVIDHGLFGVQLQWKLRNVEFASTTFLELMGNMAVGPVARAFDRLLNAIDALLDSILDGIAGAGAIKEIKEAIRNSVKVMDADL